MPRPPRRVYTLESKTLALFRNAVNDAVRALPEPPSSVATWETLLTDVYTRLVAQHPYPEKVKIFDAAMKSVRAGVANAFREAPAPVDDGSPEYATIETGVVVPSGGNPDAYAT